MGKLLDYGINPYYGGRRLSCREIRSDAELQKLSTRRILFIHTH